MGAELKATPIKYSLNPTPPPKHTNTHTHNIWQGSSETVKPIPLGEIPFQAKVVPGVPEDNRSKTTTNVTSLTERHR